MGADHFSNPDDSDISSKCSNDDGISHIPTEREEHAQYIMKVRTDESVKSKKLAISRAINVERSVSRAVSRAGTDVVSRVTSRVTINSDVDVISVVPSSAARSFSDLMSRVPTERESCDTEDCQHISRVHSAMSGAQSYLPISAAPSVGGMSVGQSIFSGRSVKTNRSIGFVAPVIQHFVPDREVSPAILDIVAPYAVEAQTDQDRNTEESVTIKISYKPKSWPYGLSCCRPNNRRIHDFESRNNHVLLKIKIHDKSQKLPRLISQKKMGVITGCTLNEIFEMMPQKMHQKYASHRNYLRQVKIDDDNNMYIEDNGQHKFIVYHEIDRIYSSVQLYDLNIQKIPSNAVVENARTNVMQYLHNDDFSIFYDIQMQELVCFGIDDKFAMRTYDHVLKLRGGVPYINLMDMCT